MYKNIKEAEALIVRYRGITMEEIENIPVPVHNNFGGFVTKKLTGFGSGACTLCKPIRKVRLFLCTGCIYEGDIDGCSEGDIDSCSEGVHEESYFAIQYASNAKELKIALNNRADHIEAWLKGISKEERKDLERFKDKMKEGLVAGGLHREFAKLCFSEENSTED